MSEATIIAAESTHWYRKDDGSPCYEVPRAKGDGMRAATLADARKLGLVRSVTSIIQAAARPGLEAWKATQLLQSALTLPKLSDETLDDYAERVIEDSKAQGKKAAEAGTELHAAIEKFAAGEGADDKWRKHLMELTVQCHAQGIMLSDGNTEHSFATSQYGGKIDWHNDEWLLDFKSKQKIDGVKKLAWPENCWQLAAYNVGIGPQLGDNLLTRRCANVFVGVEDARVLFYEWTPEDLLKGWKMFECLLSFVQLRDNYP